MKIKKPSVRRRKAIKCDGCRGPFPFHTHWCGDCLKKLMPPRVWARWVRMALAMNLLLPGAPPALIEVLREEVRKLRVHRAT